MDFADDYNADETFECQEFMDENVIIHNPIKIMVFFYFNRI